ncbi:uncharacterized protein [Glycine max]|uniref:uncharacterized protein isoform X2 n=1 Tax=Glycine max TaxID=3847 RepID=UPI001B358163|nr:uncharacterized protein LOC100500679 isoform X2 [Glycine max]
MCRHKHPHAYIRGLLEFQYHRCLSTPQTTIGCKRIRNMCTEILPSHSYSLDLIINPPLQKQKQNPRAEKNQRMATMTGVSLSCPRVFFNASGSPQNAHAYCILSSRFYDLTGLQNGILKRGREIFLTGCYLRTPTGGSGHSRLLPTEYLVILLDEDFQKEIVKAAKTFTAIGYKHIETGALSLGTSTPFSTISVKSWKPNKAFI